MSELAEAASEVDALAARAEDVRAWLEVVRGGAPFLSSADGRLLVGWLEAGIPVVLIQAAIDRVAARRRAKNSRSRLNLVACRREVERMLGRVAGSGAPGLPVPAAAPADGFRGWVQTLSAAADSTPTEPWTVLVRELWVIADGSGTADARAQAAVAACRRFHLAVWEQDPEEKQARRTWATEQLLPLRAAMSEEHFAGAVDELAREAVRARYPSVSASAVWDSLQP